MATIDIKNLDGKSVGNVELDDAVFGVEVNEHLLWEVVKMQRAKTRAGTHSTKRRDEVRGGGKKPFKQKGTGNARQGSTRAPNFVGGAKVFAPKPRDYAYSVPKKVRQLALRSALSLRATEKQLLILESIAFSEPKTKKAAELLARLNAKKALLVGSRQSTNLAKSVHNLAGAKFLPVEGLNTYDILHYPCLILSVDIAKAIEARLAVSGPAS